MNKIGKQFKVIISIFLIISLLIIILVSGDHDLGGILVGHPPIPVFLYPNDGSETRWIDSSQIVLSIYEQNNRIDINDLKLEIYYGGTWRQITLAWSEHPSVLGGIHDDGIKWTNDETIESNWDIKTDNFPDGIYVLRATMTDVLGQIGQGYSVVQLIKDPQPPIPPDECACVQMTVVTSGDAQDNLRFPPEERAPKPGKTESPKKLGKSSGDSLITPNSLAAGYNFEIRTTITGPAEKCSEQQFVKSTRTENDGTKIHVAEINGKKALVKDGDPNAKPFQSDNDNDQTSWVNDDFTKAPKDTPYKDPQTGQTTNFLQKEHKVQLIHWIDSPSVTVSKDYPASKIPITRLARFKAEVDGVGAPCTCFFTVDTQVNKVDGQLTSNSIIYDITGTKCVAG